MFTKNWYKILASGMLTAQKATPIACGAVDYTGTTRELCYYNTDRLTNVFNIRNYIGSVGTEAISSGNKSGVRFGTGTTPATMDDYNLSGNVVSTIAQNNAPTVTVDDDSATLSVVYTVTNTGSEDITISEICLFNYWYYNTSGSYSCFLLERTLLDSPVTIPAGGVGQITYTIKLVYPTE